MEGLVMCLCGVVLRPWKWCVVGCGAVWGRYGGCDMVGEGGGLEKVCCVCVELRPDMTVTF